eukprot:511526_1
MANLLETTQHSAHFTEISKDNKELIEFLKSNHLNSIITSVLSTGLNLSHFMETDENDLNELLTTTLKLNVPLKIKFKHGIKKLKRGQLSETSMSISSHSLAYIQNQEEGLDFKYKILICGDAGVGKTCIFQRLQGTKSELYPIPSSSVNCDMSTRITLKNGVSANFVIYDTPGQKIFDSSNKLYWRGIYAFIVVYDITNRNTFNSAKYRIEDIIDNAIGFDKILLIGNKYDLNENRSIPQSDGLNYATKNGISFLEVSARGNYNIETIMEWLLRQSENKYIKDKHVLFSNDTIKTFDNKPLLERKNRKKTCQC